MPGHIVGVSKSSLWLAWKEIRAELRNSGVRDVIDFLDYDIEPNVWIGRLLRQISLGRTRSGFIRSTRSSGRRTFSIRRPRPSAALPRFEGFEIHCAECDAATHMGRAMAHGYGDTALEQLCQVNPRGEKHGTLLLRNSLDT